MSILRPSLNFVVLLLGALALIDCGDDASNNQACESECVDDYTAKAPGCEQKVASCLQGCSGPDDFICISDCEDIEFDCLPLLALCAADCPCGRRVTDCARNCGASDQDCQIGCADRYADCAGTQTDTPFLCAQMCDAQKSGCQFDCESNSPDMDGYLECRQECAAEQVSCLGEC